jgi:cephalosporin hydroxylase
MWVYQEIIYATSPDVIIECGVARGGSSLFLADMCEAQNRGVVIAIDKQLIAGLPTHSRLIYLEGDSVGEEVRKTLLDRLFASDSPNSLRIMAILDSDHSPDHVYQELCFYGNLVTVGCYLIVEDGNPFGLESATDALGGPMIAIKHYLSEDDRWVVDREKERFLITYNPMGYLKKVRY